ncbi:MAG: hypothetical protein JNM29_01220 [Candidatus Odyssella sp.]|nr:hypothetical protein [Candidatus Odyssella sp.]
MTGAELRAVLAALPESVCKDACEGWFRWRGGEKLPDGSISMPWCEYGPRFDALWAALRQVGALDDTDYGRWPGLTDYLSGAKRIADAPRSDVAKWLFAVYRSARFVEGGWADQLRLGRLKEAVARLAELDAQGG